MADPLLIYGASGYTGGLCARQLRSEGVAAILAGRNGDKLRALSSELGCSYRVAALEDAAQLAAALAGVKVVLNAAGPFSRTAGPLLQACLRAGVHYLDISGELASHDLCARHAGDAAGTGVMLLPGVGFDVVPSDCLAVQVASRLPGARQLHLGIAGLTLVSRGSAHTLVDQLVQPVWVRREGALRQIPPGSLERAFDFGQGPRPSVAVSWADVASGYYSTGIPNITVYFEATAAVRMHTAMVRSFGWAVPLTPWQSWLHRASELLPEGPSEAERARARAVMVAEADDGQGRTARARLHTPEAYGFTAITAAAIVRRVLDGDLAPGLQTPGRLYGADFVLSLPGVVREDC